MTRTKTLVSLAVAAGLGWASASQAGVEWNISVGLPATIQVVSAPAPVYAAAPVVSAAPSIEQMQAQQQARIQWGSQVGLITGHEYYRLQQTQSYIEQQRQWAYADGWLTYDEQTNLINLLNGASQQIERALVNWQRVNTTYYPMPPALTVWSVPPAYYGNQAQYGHHGHRPPPAVPVQLVVQPKPPVYGQRPPAQQPGGVQPAAQPQGVPQHPGHREAQPQLFQQPDGRQDLRPMKF